MRWLLPAFVSTALAQPAGIDEGARKTDPSRAMTVIAANLTQADIAAVALYYAATTGGAQGPGGNEPAPTDSKQR